MAFEPRNNSFALFPNEHKEHEVQPDFRGVVVIRGERIPLVGWSRNSSRTGKPFISGQVVIEALGEEP